MRFLLGVALLAVTLAGCTSPPPSANPPGSGGSSQPAPSGPAHVQAVGGEQGNFFQPNQTSVKAGQQVTWTGQSGHHTVTFQQAVDGNGTAPDSGDLGPGQGFTLRFPAPGTYAYRCRYHSSGFGPGGGMTGTVVVS